MKSHSCEKMSAVLPFQVSRWAQVKNYKLASSASLFMFFYLHRLKQMSDFNLHRKQIAHPLILTVEETVSDIPCMHLPMSRSVQPEGAPAARTPCNATDVDKKMLAFSLAISIHRSTNHKSFYSNPTSE